MMDDKIKAALSELSAAKAQLGEARRTLAEQTKPGDPSILVDPDWFWAEELFEKRREKLLAIDGVVGCGLGHRIKDGRETSEPCITVLVRRKVSEATLKKQSRKRVPRFVRDGKQRLPVDVVQLGRLERQAQIHAGVSIGPTGKSRSGTLGFFAQDMESDGIVALTAMHVSGRYEYPAANSSANVRIDFSLKDDAGAPVFGYLQRGSRTGIDAAKIRLASPQDALPDIPKVREIRGWRPMVYPTDRGISVEMYGAKSSYESGYIVNPAISIPAESLDFAILAKIDSKKGDSGAALVDYEGYVLGFLVGSGRKHNLAVFCPASLVLGRLKCEIPNS